MNTNLYIFLAFWTERSFLSWMCVHLSVELNNFFIIVVMLMDSFLCMHHVGFNVLELVIWRSHHFHYVCVLSKVTYTAMICTLVWNLFSRFYCFDGVSNTKNVKTQETDRYILDEMHASLSLLSHKSFTIDVV